MYKKCKTEKSALRQRELEQGLLRLMLQHRYEDISVCDLCSELEIPRKAFYRYFSGKEGALYSLIDRTLMDYDVYTTSHPDAWDSTESYMMSVFSYWTEHKQLLDALKKNGMGSILIQRALVCAKDLDVLPNFVLMQEGKLQEYGIMFLICGLMSMIVQWHYDGFFHSEEEMAQLAVQLFSQPLFADS